MSSSRSARWACRVGHSPVLACPVSVYGRAGSRGRVIITAWRRPSALSVKGRQNRSRGRERPSANLMSTTVKLRRHGCAQSTFTPLRAELWRRLQASPPATILVRTDPGARLGDSAGDCNQHGARCWRGWRHEWHIPLFPRVRPGSGCPGMAHPRPSCPCRQGAPPRRALQSSPARNRSLHPRGRAVGARGTSGTDVGTDAAAGRGGRDPDGLAREMRVALGVPDVGMAQ